MIRNRYWFLTLSVFVLLGLFALAACAEDTEDEGAESETDTEEEEAAAAEAEDTDLIIAADIVLGSKNIPEEEKPDKSCVLSSRYPRNSEMVWRARIIDPATGEEMDDSQISEAKAELATGETIVLEYGPHPKDPPNEYFWTGSWVVPEDHATGTLEYTINVTGADDRTGEFEPFGTQPSLPAITDEVLEDIEEE